MTEHKHTPGPWTVEDLGFEDIRIRDESAQRAVICTMARWLPPYHAERNANSHLIAAAPDLLEALEQMLAAHNIDAPECVFARAAIAKAKGEM